MSNRTDVHSPKNFEPADYEYVGSFDQWPEPGTFFSQDRNDYRTPFGVVNALNVSHAEYIAGRDLIEKEGVHIHHDGSKGEIGAGCDHCGAHIRYVSIFRHKPTNKVLAVGSTCANDRFGCETRRDYDIKKLKERAAHAKEAARVFGKASDFVEANCPELRDWLLTPAAETVHPIFADLGRKLIKYGTLSPKQLAFAHKLLREYYERQRNGGKTDREIAWEEEKAKAEDCPNGRLTITGKVIKTEVRDGQFGTEFKMIVKDERGFCVWVTIPEVLRLFTVDNSQRALMKGDKIAFIATVARSEKDPKFGFGKRPKMARLLEPVQEEVF